jgi:hypothetical protein
MPWVEKLFDPQELPRYIRDLVTLSALATISRDYDPDQIADSIATTPVSIMDADFIYARLGGMRSEPTLEMLRTSSRFAPNTEQIHFTLLTQLADRPLDQFTETTSLHSDETLRIVSVPVGFDKMRSSSLEIPGPSSSESVPTRSP